MKFVISVILLCLFSSSILAQDSLKLASELSVEIRGQHILSALHENEKAYETISELGQVTDNPFHHFAIFSGINYTGTLNDRYTFNTGLYMEERSFSGGNNTVKNLVLFPKIKLSAIDTLRLGNVNLKTDFSAGDFWNEDFGDMLRIYNIDFQGLKTRFGLGKMWLGFDVIGDLSRNIGFDLHELYKFSVSYKEDNFINTVSVSVNELLDSNRGEHNVPRDYNVANYYRWNLKDRTSLEIQFDYRVNDKMQNAYAIGSKVTHKIDNLFLTTALRYYSKRFNQGYESYKPSYRKFESYVGDQLYPLKNFFRPINQWALMTEYGSLDVFNFEFTTQWDQKLYKKLFMMTNIDFNVIMQDDGDISNYYPFYDIGLKMKFHEKFTFAISGTNKHMDLINFYQTSNPSKYPFLTYAFHMDLDRIKLGTKYL